MNKLDELIKELCPLGVEFVPLWSVTAWDKKFNAVDKSMQTKVYKYPVLLAKDLFAMQQNKGNVFLLSTGTETGWTTEEIAGDYLCEGEVVTLPWGKSSPVKGLIKYYNGKFVTGDNRIATSLDTEKLLNKYLYYWMVKYGDLIDTFYRGSGIKHPSMLQVLTLKIALPPLAVQREIVRILDNFTKLTAELTAELTARKKQYEFYRDKLLTPKAEIKTVELGEVCTFVRGPFGGALKKEIFQPHGYAVYEQQHAIYRTLDFRYFIDKKKFDELKKFSIKPGDMIISCSGTIGKTFVIPEDAPEGVINQALLKLTPHDELNVFYLQYFFENTISKELNGVARGGAIKNVPSVSELKAIRIPVPSLDVQERLVQVLDNFDAICSDLKIGLPAEIEARKKQYEFYRDALLTYAATGKTILTDRQTDRQA